MSWPCFSIAVISLSRLGYLEDREAAPGTDPKEGLPMDDWETWHLKKVPGGFEFTLEGTTLPETNIAPKKLGVGWISFWDGLFAEETIPTKHEKENRRLESAGCEKDMLGDRHVFVWLETMTLCGKDVSFQVQTKYHGRQEPSTVFFAKGRSAEK